MFTKLKAASLFAGIGGICLGFKQSGVEIVWANEFDKDACKTYRYNFGDSYLCEEDIINVDEKDIPDVDMILAGFPCQPFSVAGYRKGFEDERGNLFFEIMKIVNEKKPRIVFLENVKNLATHDNGNTYKIIKETLESDGYSVTMNVLNTMNFANIPQNRERIYIIAFLNENDYINFRFPDSIPLTKTIKDIIDYNDKKDESFYYTNTKYYPELKREMTNKDTIYQWRRKYVRENKSKVCPTLTANMGTGGHNVPLIKDNYDIRKLTPLECLAFQGFPNNYSFPDTISKASCYKQAGNSVSVPVIYRIANEIINAIEQTNNK